MEVRTLHKAGRLLERVMAVSISFAESSFAGSSGGGSEPHEQAGAAPSAAARRLPLVVEALGYLGAVLALVAGLSVVRQLLPAISPGAELGFAGVATAALLMVGVMLPVEGQPALGRLRSVLWLGSAVGMAGFAGLLAGPHFANLGPAAWPLSAEAVATAYAVVLWWRWPATLQHLAVFGGAITLTVTGITQIWDGYPPWQLGVGLWVLSLLWGIAAHRGYLAPRTAGYAAAGIGLLAGAVLNIGRPAGQALAVATVAGLLAAGVALRRVLLLGLGAAGAIVILPQVAGQYLHGMGSAVALLAAGLAILGAALWLARARARA